MEAVTFSVADAVNVLSEAGSCRTPFSPLVAAPGAICLAESQQPGRDAFDPRSTCHGPREVQAVTGHQTPAMVRKSRAQASQKRLSRTAQARRK